MSRNITTEVKIITRRKFWLMPLLYLIGIFFKIIRREAPDKLINWLACKGFTMELKNG